MASLCNPPFLTHGHLLHVLGTKQYLGLPGEKVHVMLREAHDFTLSHIVAHDRAN